MAGGALPPFGELLRRYRRAARLTQEELAGRAGLSASTVSTLERATDMSKLSGLLAGTHA